MYHLPGSTTGPQTRCDSAICVFCRLYRHTWPLWRFSSLAAIVIEPFLLNTNIRTQQDMRRCYQTQKYMASLWINLNLLNDTHAKSTKTTMQRAKRTRSLSSTARLFCNRTWAARTYLGRFFIAPYLSSLASSSRGLLRACRGTISASYFPCSGWLWPRTHTAK